MLFDFVKVLGLHLGVLFTVHTESKVLFGSLLRLFVVHYAAVLSP